MASSITSAGSASGMDFESIISALVSAKKTSINKSLTTKKEEANIELSGVGSLKSALETFQKSIEALTEDNGFNTRKVTTDLPTENPYFSVTANEDAANGEFDIAVTQLAKSDKLSASFDDADQTLTAGKLTITLPDVKNDDGTTTKRSFTIDVADDDTIVSLRKKINNNDYGINASTITLSDGSVKLVIDSGESGDDSSIAMSYVNDSSVTDDYIKDNNKLNGAAIFNLDTSKASAYDSATNFGTSSKTWNFTNGQDAIISVDGEELRSDTNEFRDTISGLTINVNRVSDKDSTTNQYVTNNVVVSADTDSITNKMSAFVSAYNTLISTMDTLYEHNTYTDGENNYDGGELAGDSMLRSLKSQIQNLMTNVQANSSGLDIYSIGIEFDSDGVMSLDTTTFKDNVADNFNALVNLFSGEGNDKNSTDDDGVLVRLNSLVEQYTKSNGILADRLDDLNQEISRYEDEENENETYMEEYEANLRQRYSKLDTTIANYNNSLSYLSSALS